MCGLVPCAVRRARRCGAGAARLAALRRRRVCQVRLGSMPREAVTRVRLMRRQVSVTRPQLQKRNKSCAPALNQEVPRPRAPAPARAAGRQERCCAVRLVLPAACAPAARAPRLPLLTRAPAPAPAHPLLDRRQRILAADMSEESSRGALQPLAAARGRRAGPSAAPPPVASRCHACPPRFWPATRAPASVLHDHGAPARSLGLERARARACSLAPDRPPRAARRSPHRAGG